MSEAAAWLETPLVLETAAFEIQKDRLFEAELQRIRDRKLLTFEVEEPEED